MLQTAARAADIGAPPALIVAALLHDVGHLLHPEGETAAEAGVDIGHEALGAVWLSQSFGPDITAPIALHVEAKRYLCAVDPSYHERLSEASRASLRAQGGIMSAREIDAFRNTFAFEHAIMLRRCDDDGKDTLGANEPLESYRSLLARYILHA
jgi:[1-hydroxy-2-(trimethylamino)ethyl]phosphonate dioxygenase